MFVKQIAPVSRTKSLNQIIRNIFISVPCNTIKSSNFNSNHIVSILSNQNQVNYSRFSATTIMTGTDLFKISDYDYVGFDLDNTLLQYKVRIDDQPVKDTTTSFVVRFELSFLCRQQ